MLKYIIFKNGDVVIGSLGHYDLFSVKGSFHKIADRFILSAGRIRLKNGKLETYGESYTFGIKSRPEDSELIKSLLDK